MAHNYLGATLLMLGRHQSSLRKTGYTWVCLTSVAALVTACSSSANSGTTTQSGGGASASARSATSLKLPFATTTLTYGASAGDDVPIDATVTKAPAAGNGGSTDVGVTSTSITITQLISLSGIGAGVFQGVADSAKAYATYINSLGGIYGRKLNLIIGDDAFDVTKDQAVCANDVPKSFALVSGLATGDTGCYPLMKSSNIPIVTGLVFDPRIYALPGAFTPRPDYYGNLNLALWMALHPGIKKVWLCEENVPGIAAQAAPEKAAWESLGVQVLNLPPLDGTATDYAAPVLQAKNAGAQAVDCFSPAPQLSSKIAIAMQQQGWNPAVKIGYSAAESTFVQLAGSAANGWGASITVPYQDPKLFASTPGGKLYEKWAGGLPKTVQDALGWEYMALFVQGLIKAGPDLTRVKLVAALRTIKNFTAYGLVPPFDAGTKGAASSCIALGQVTDGKFQQVAPKSGQLVCGGKFFS